MTRRLALVVQRYGPAVSGGAELAARGLAEQLCALADVTVLTTCALDYTTWANHYPAGESWLNGVRVWRFPVDAPRHWAREQRATGAFLNRDHTLLDEQEWMRRQGPNSAALLAAIEASYAAFDLFIFFTYLYAPAFYGLPLVADKAILIPMAHEDPFLAMPLFRPLFHLPRLIAYNTFAEQALVQRLTRNGHIPAQVIGFGVEGPPQPAEADRFRRKFGLDAPFLLYVGRLAASKNVPQLCDHFLHYKQSHANDLKLVLVGKGDVAVPPHPDIVLTGFVSEQEKFEALAAATVVVVPSQFESLSIIALEGWLMSRPVLVNGRCQVLVEQCRRSQAGLYYTHADEFAALVDYLLAQPHHAAALGRNGRRFVERHYQWSVVLDKYRALLDVL